MFYPVPKQVCSILYLWSVEEASSVLGGLTETTTFLRRSLRIERNRYKKENEAVESGGVEIWRQREETSRTELNGMEKSTKEWP